VNGVNQGALMAAGVKWQARLRRGTLRD
jgi:hypothetical protein